MAQIITYIYSDNSLILHITNGQCSITTVQEYAYIYIITSFSGQCYAINVMIHTLLYALLSCSWSMKCGDWSLCRNTLFSCDFSKRVPFHTENTGTVRLASITKPRLQLQVFYVQMYFCMYIELCVV